jgi:hypothetical protein
MMKVKIVCAITMLAALPAAAETKSPPIRQALVHEYARKQLPLARPHMQRLMPVTNATQPAIAPLAGMALERYPVRLVRILPL